MRITQNRYPSRSLHYLWLTWNRKQTMKLNLLQLTPSSFNHICDWYPYRITIQVCKARYMHKYYPSSSWKAGTPWNGEKILTGSSTHSSHRVTSLVHSRNFISLIWDVCKRNKCYKAVLGSWIPTFSNINGSWALETQQGFKIPTGAMSTTEKLYHSSLNILFTLLFNHSWI